MTTEDKSKLCNTLGGIAGLIYTAQQKCAEGRTAESLADIELCVSMLMSASREIYMASHVSSSWVAI